MQAGGEHAGGREQPFCRCQGCQAQRKAAKRECTEEIRVDDEDRRPGKLGEVLREVCLRDEG